MAFCICFAGNTWTLTTYDSGVAGPEGDGLLHSGKCLYVIPGAFPWSSLRTLLKFWGLHCTWSYSLETAALSSCWPISSSSSKLLALTVCKDDMG